MKNLKKCTAKELAKILGDNAMKLTKMESTDETKVLVNNYKAMYDKAQEDPKSIKKSEMLLLAEAMQQVMADEFIEDVQLATVENSSKKNLKKKPVAEETTTPEEETPVAEEAKEDAEASSVVVRKDKHGEEYIEEFAKELEFDGDKYVLATEIKDMADLYDALSKDSEDYLFAHAWTPRMLRQYNYFDNALGTPESFPNNLDISTVVYISEEKKVAYVVSAYTEVFYTILAKEVAPIDNVRMSNGIEYEIYKKVK